MSDILDIHARQILDYGAILQWKLMFCWATAGLAARRCLRGSTGAYEAIEMRDTDQASYGGKGVMTAVDAVNREIFDALSGADATDQLQIDTDLIALDGTDNKARLAQMRFWVSLAVAGPQLIQRVCRYGGIWAVFMLMFCRPR